jgi:hypothetical protein
MRLCPKYESLLRLGLVSVSLNQFAIHNFTLHRVNISKLYFPYFIRHLQLHTTITSITNVTLSSSIPKLLIHQQRIHYPAISSNLLLLL